MTTADRRSPARSGELQSVPSSVWARVLHRPQGFRRSGRRPPQSQRKRQRSCETASCCATVSMPESSIPGPWEGKQAIKKTESDKPEHYKHVEGCELRIKC